MLWSNKKRKKEQLKLEALDDLFNLCDQANGTHGYLSGISPDDDQEKHMWFKAKMISDDEFISRVEKMSHVLN